MHRAATQIAKEHGYADRGYRTVFNTNREAAIGSERQPE